MDMLQGQSGGALRGSVGGNPNIGGATVKPLPGTWGTSGVSEEVLVSARANPVEVESTSRASVLTNEFMNRIPTGRSYQSAITFAAGVQDNGTGNPHMAGAPNENMYLLDGVDVTDPVSGALPMTLSFDDTQQIEALLGGLMPEYSKAGRSIVNVVTVSGNNNLEAGVTASRMQALDQDSGLGWSQVGGFLSGPTIRDMMWFHGGYQFDGTRNDGRTFNGHSGFAKIVTQPSNEHRLTLSSKLDLARINDDGVAMDQRGTLGMGRWQWFLGPEVHLETVAALHGFGVGDDRRQREQAHTKLSVLSLDDPVGGTHDLKFGLEAERVGWRLDGQSLAVFAPGVPQDTSMGRFGAFAQDSYKPVANVTLNVGLRTDLTLGRWHTGPRFYMAWDPFKDQRTKLAIGYGRWFGHLGLPNLFVERSEGLSELQEVLAIAEREIVRDVAIGVTGTARRREGIPTLDGRRVQREALIGEVFLRKIYARRWFLDASYRRTVLQDPGTGTLVDDGSLEGFGHNLRGHVAWEFPNDPHTTTFNFMGQWLAQPLGTLAPDPTLGEIPNAPRWRLAGQVTQAVDVRKGVLEFEVEASYLNPQPDARSLVTLVGFQPPILPLEGWEGPRLRGGVRYRF